MFRRANVNNGLHEFKYQILQLCSVQHASFYFETECISFNYEMKSALRHVRVEISSDYNIKLQFIIMYLFLNLKSDLILLIIAVLMLFGINICSVIRLILYSYKKGNAGYASQYQKHQFLFLTFFFVTFLKLIFLI